VQAERPDLNGLAAERCLPRRTLGGCEHAASTEFGATTEQGCRRPSSMTVFSAPRTRPRLYSSDVMIFFERGSACSRTQTVVTSAMLRTCVVRFRGGAAC